MRFFRAVFVAAAVVLGGFGGGVSAADLSGGGGFGGDVAGDFGADFGGEELASGGFGGVAFNEFGADLRGGEFGGDVAGDFGADLRGGGSFGGGATLAGAIPASATSANPAIPSAQKEMAIVLSIKNVGTNFTLLNRYLRGGEWAVKHVSCSQGSCLIILRRQ